MTIDKVLKILSSSSKLKLLIHFSTCSNPHSSVNNLVEKFKLKQSNLSKHLIDLRMHGILKTKRVGKTIFYSMNLEFQRNWSSLLDFLVNTSHDLKTCVCLDCHKISQVSSV